MANLWVSLPLQGGSTPGPPGPPGTPGSVWYTGAGAPSSGLGLDGDFYLDSVAPNDYYEKIAGSWVLQGQLSGLGVQSVTGLNTDNTDPVNPVVQISVDGVTVTGDGTPGNPLVATTGGTGTVTSVNATVPPAFNVSGVPITGAGTIAITAAGTTAEYIAGDGTLVTLPNIVNSVTGLNTDNTDPLNPIVQISVDGSTVTGDGTPGNPLSATGGGTVTSVALAAPPAFSVSGSPVTTSGTLTITGAGTAAQYVRGDGTLATTPTGTVTSVGLSMPAAFSVTGSPVTTSGTIAVTAVGTSAQYIRGDGALATTPTGTVTNVATGTGLTGGPITTSGTINLSNTAVTPGSYTNTNLTVDAQGRITAASNGSSSGGITALTGDVTASGTGSVAATLATTYKRDKIGVVLNGQGGVIQVNSFSQASRIPFTGTIVGWEIISTGLNGVALSGSIVVDIWIGPNGSIPTVANTIFPSGKPTLSSASYNTSGVLSIAVTAGQIALAKVDSATTCVLVEVSLQVTRS